VQKLWKSLTAHETSPLPLAVFRIAYGVVLLVEVCQLFYFRHLVFDEIPYLQPAETAPTYALVAWIGAVCCLILGLFTRAACLVNYILSVVLLSQLTNFDYHCDHIYLGVNLLLMFAPVGDALSLDRLRTQPSGAAHSGRRATVSGFYANAIVFVAAGLVYFDSFFWKCNESMWQDGLGVWLPMSLPQDTWLPPKFINSLANQKTLVHFLSYLTLVFEAVFVFAMWFKSMRLGLVLIGVGLHLGILVAFPIPLFGLTMLALYLLVLPPESFDRAESWLHERRARRHAISVNSVIPRTDHTVARQRGLTISAGASVARQQAIPRHRWSLRFTAAITAIAALMQLLLILETPVLGLKDYADYRPPTQAETNYAGFKTAMFRLTGISSHAVFLDAHFKGSDRIIAVTYMRADGSQEPIPIFSEYGTAQRYAFGRFWCNWLFQCTHKHCDLATIERGVRRYTAFWAAKNNISLNDATFSVQVKRLDTIGKWERDFLWRQTQKPWQLAANGTWQNNQFQFAALPELLK
jgi:hypothetical protein